MKKGFLFTGLLIALILLGGYVLLAKDAKENIDSTLIRLGLRSAQPIEQPAQPQQAILIKSTPAEKKAPAVKEAPAEKEVPDAKKARKVEEEPVKIPEPVIDWPSTSAMGSAYVAKPAVKKVDKKAPQTEMEALPKTMSKKDRIELIGQRIDELKMQGLEYTDLLNELNNLHGGATKPARRHLDATGDDCTDPIVITLPADLPFTDAAQTNCGRLDDYENTCLGYYDSGEDIIYQLTVTATCTVEIGLDPGTTTYTGICIDDECPPADPCMAFSTRGYSGGAHGLDCMILDPGTYYIMIDTWSAPDCIPSFDLTINTCTYVDPCTPDVSVTLPAALPYSDLGQTNCGLEDDFNAT
ncbi:hypothetical protein KKB28_00280, partial [bacterium]|nr:hypothetical protein [bacterium]